ncbi:MAG: chemotaxis protein CheB [Verrucomicrobiales bacterium]
MTTGNDPTVTANSEASDAPGEVDRPDSKMRVVGVGASAGGMEALKRLFAEVPEQPGVCFVVVVHLSPEHESHLARLLQPHSRIPVQQVTETIPMERDHVYVIPPGVNLDAIDTHLRLSDLEEKRNERAPIDHFFRTLAEAHGERSVGVVLTGTGSDGTLGLRRIRESGGLTIVQSPEEAQYDAMPRSAVRAGVADLTLPLNQIVSRILQVDRHEPPPLEVSEDDSPPAEKADRTLQKILNKVSGHTGHDFTSYKRSTVGRRVRRRMQLHRVQQLEEYLQLLEDQAPEIDLLFEDLLITVTEFFRDPEVFDHVESEVIPKLFEDKGPNDRVRAWSVGCATGEEAYTLAMLLAEEESRREIKPRQVQVFASDLHEPSLRKAREGLYPDSIEDSVSPARLRQFFTKQNDSYGVRKNVRERIVFAGHNVLQDPPFSHVQLICCRNLLIYLQRDVQEHLTRLFHYALEEGGYLLLGTAEAIGSELFVCENKKNGLYRRRSVTTPKFKPASTPLSAKQRSADDPEPQTRPRESHGEMHQHVVEQYAPPSVLINHDGEVLHSSARAGRFLQVPGGAPTSNLFQLAPDPLRSELRAAIHSARNQGAGYRSRPVSLSLDGRERRVAIRAQPIDQPRMQGCFLVIFDELEDAEEPGSEAERTDATVRELEAEVERTRQHMQSVIDEHEATKQRMQAYNEELESSNEELRSTMEELESSKEEMESMNEELTTVNQENQQKVEELDRLSGDLHNLLTATDIATVFLDRDMRVLRFTPSMAELFNMRDSDRGRLLADITHRLRYEQLQEDFQHVLDHLAPVEREVADEQDRWYLVRLQCYRTADERIKGAVITFIDITERKRAEEGIREAKYVADEVANTVRNPMLVLTNDLRVRSANTAFNTMFFVDPGEIDGRLVYELNQGQWDIPKLRRLLEEILPENKAMEDYELEHEFEGLGQRVLLLNARRIDHLQLILLAIEDITERKQKRQALEQSHDELDRQVRQRTAQLHQQTQRLQHLVRELSSAEQRERKRMAAVLHDELQQLLVSIKMQLNTARGGVPDTKAVASIDAAVQTVEKALETTRTLVRQMTPTVLYEQGLIPALNWLRDEMSRRHGLNVKIVADEGESPLHEQTSVILFDGVREMLFNIVKHAGVNEAEVTVHRDRDRLQVEVRDEGAGFDVDAEAARVGKSGFGLFSLGERLKALGGDCSIESAPDQGTRVRMEVPLGQGAAEEAAESEPAARSPADATEPFEGSLRVLVVDDHALVREGIVNVLNQEPETRVVDHVEDGVEAVAAVERHEPDVVLMDVNMPRMNGIEATREIRRRWPNVIVIGLSVEDSNGDAARAMRAAGAAAFIPKADTADRMIETIRKLAE